MSRFSSFRRVVAVAVGVASLTGGLVGFTRPVEVFTGNWVCVSPSQCGAGTYGCSAKCLETCTCTTF